MDLRGVVRVVWAFQVGAHGDHGIPMKWAALSCMTTTCLRVIEFVLTQGSGTTSIPFLMCLADAWIELGSITKLEIESVNVVTKWPKIHLICSNSSTLANKLRWLPEIQRGNVVSMDNQRHLVLPLPSWGNISVYPL